MSTTVYPKEGLCLAVTTHTHTRPRLLPLMTCLKFSTDPGYASAQKQQIFFVAGRICSCISLQRAAVQLAAFQQSPGHKGKSHLHM